MKTRTLLMLALACGLVIMVAGAVFLFQLAGQDDASPAAPIGEPVRVGDMTVTVVGADESAGVLAVAVRIGGVDDADAADGFRLIASGRAVEPERADAGDGDACGATTATTRRCVVRFDVGGADGTSRVLFYDRGEDGARWVLS